jgi:hypothetical protein
MGKSMKEILEKGSKNKLIQLALDTPDFDRSGVAHPTLSEEDIELIWDKAKEEGWDKELKRALYKARDTEALALHTKGTFYEAMFYLSDFTKEVQRSEIFLDMIRHEYLKNYNKETGEYEKAIKKDRKEVKKYLKEVLDKILPALNIRINSTYIRGLRDNLKEVHGEEADKEYKEARKGIEDDKWVTEAPYKMFRNLISGAKMGLYLIKGNKLEGYRLYREDIFTDINFVALWKLHLLAMDLILSLEHIDFMLDNIPKYLPEVAEELEQMEDMYLPDKKSREEMIEFLRDKIALDGLLEDMKKAESKEEKAKAWKKHLLNDIPEDVLKIVEKSEDKVEKYVKYGE